MNIIDVDFRYVTRKVQGSESRQHVETVLQWRKKVKKNDGSFCLALHSDGTSIALSDEWMDWQDVRTEEE